MPEIFKNIEKAIEDFSKQTKEFIDEYKKETK